MKSSYFQDLQKETFFVVGSKQQEWTMTPTCMKGNTIDTNFEKLTGLAGILNILYSNLQENLIRGVTISI